MNRPVIKKTAIIHYLPLEYYPPVTNLLDFLSKQNSFKTKVFSSHNTKKRKTFFAKNINIKRFQSAENLKNPVSRLIRYYIFNLFTFFHLLRYNPEIVIYFESYSAWPVYWYMKYFGKSKKLWTHYHEFFPEQWYEEGMKTVKKYHKKEKKLLYNLALGISQTNAFRVDLFAKEHPSIESTKLHILQNYPPINWKPNIQEKQNNNSVPLKIVYVGSLSIKNTYIKKLCDWVLTKKDEIQFDIFSYNHDQETLNYLLNISTGNINFYRSGVEYYELPKILSQYDVGVILYRNFNQNFTYNETNKLFEYLACGLDVWFSEETKGIYKHITENTWPKVVKLDYNRLDNYSLEELIDHKGLTYKPSEYYCEEVYEGFLKKLKAKG